MSLQSLPVELLTAILDPLVPENCCAAAESRRECLDLRLVCRIFDSIVSRLAFQKTNLPQLGWQNEPLNSRTAKWLFRTKASLDPESNKIAVAYLRDWALFLNAQRDWNPDPSIGVEQWLDAVCGTVILQLGARWALEDLVCSAGEGTTKLKCLSLCLSRSLLGCQRPTGPKGTKLVQMTHGLLQIASHQGNVTAAKSILNSGADPNYRHSHFGYALHNAVYSNHVEIIRLLVQHGASLHSNGDFGYLIQLAAEEGYTESFRYLLSLAEVNHTAHFNRCLSTASAKGHEGVVQALFQWAENKKGKSQKRSSWINWLRAKRPPVPDPNFVYEEHGPPLTAAVKNGHVGLVQILLSHDGTQGFRNDRHCPLFAAVKHDRADILTLFLNRYTLSSNTILHTQKTLLCTAAEFGSITVVRMLLNREDIDPNARAQDEHSMPLFQSVHNGHVEVIQELLSRDDIDPNARQDGLTPLGDAVQQLNEAVMRVLLQCPRVDPNLQYKGVTPLIDAIHLDKIVLVAATLERPDTDPNLVCESNNFSTPIRVAVRRGDVSIVQELLKREDLNPNKCRSNNEARGLPPTFTSRVRSSRIVELLLARSDIDVQVAGWSSNSPLAEAVGRREYGLMELLLARPELDVNYSPKRYNILMLHSAPKGTPRYNFLWASNENGITIRETALNKAAEAPALPAVKALLAHPQIKMDVSDSTRRPTLWWAAMGGSIEVVKLILEHGGHKDINTQDIQGWTALHVAVNIGKIDVVGCLLGHPDIYPNVINNDGLTPMHLAVLNSNADMVAELLRHPMINCHRRLTEDGKTPLELAEKLQFIEGVKVLKEFQNAKYCMT